MNQKASSVRNHKSKQETYRASFMNTLWERKHPHRADRRRVSYGDLLMLQITLSTHSSPTFAATHQLQPVARSSHFKRIFDKYSTSSSWRRRQASHLFDHMPYFHQQRMETCLLTAKDIAIPNPPNNNRCFDRRQFTNSFRQKHLLAYSSVFYLSGTI